MHYDFSQDEDWLWAKAVERYWRTRNKTDVNGTEESRREAMRQRAKAMHARRKAKDARNPV
jgi:hypothetical protein